MINKLDRWIDDGVQGGSRGLEIDFENNIVTKWNGEEGSLDEWDKKEIIWVIEGNIEYHQRRIIHLNERLSIKEKTIIPFRGGHKVREPLTEEVRKKFELSLKEHSDEMVELNQLLNKYLNQNKDE